MIKVWGDIYDYYNWNIALCIHVLKHSITHKYVGTQLKWNLKVEEMGIKYYK